MELSILVDRLFNAKRALDSAAENVKLLQRQVAEALDTGKTEGTDKAEVSTADHTYKVTVTRKVMRTLDADLLEQALPALPQPLVNRLIHYRPQLDTREWKYICDNEPEYAAQLADAVTTRPASPYVKVELADRSDK